MTGSAELYFAQAVHCTARDLPALHEQPVRWPERALEELFHSWYADRAESLGCTAVKRQALMSTPHWPRVGKVDLEICAPDRIWIEFKWPTFGTARGT